MTANLKQRLAESRFARFALVGGVSTVAYLALVAFMQPSLGQDTANVLALLLTALANTTVNRSFTFGVRGRESLFRDEVAGLLAFAFGLAFTSAAMWLLVQTGQEHRIAVELPILAVASGVATVVRFTILSAVMTVRTHQIRPRSAVTTAAN